MSRQIVVRLILTLALFLVGGYIQMILNPILTVHLGEIAGNQFQNSDAVAVQTNIAMSFLTGIGGLISLTHFLGHASARCCDFTRTERSIPS